MSRLVVRVFQAHSCFADLYSLSDLLQSSEVALGARNNPLYGNHTQQTAQQTVLQTERQPRIIENVSDTKPSKKQRSALCVNDSAA